MFKVESFACALFGAKTKISHPKTRFFAVVHNHKNQAAPLSTQEAHLPHAIGSELGIVLQLILALLAALVGGAVAFRLRQPVILGYLLGGIVFGPYVLRVVQDIEGVRAVAELGVALLMFALGIHLSFRELRQVQRVAVIGGAIQVLLTIGLGLAVGAAFDWDPAQAAFFGALMALSSTMVVLKVLQERGELDSLYGRITVGLLVIQDLSVVPLMVIMPTLGGRGGDTPIELGIAVAKAALVLGATVILGTRLVPAVLFRVAATHSRELFLLTVVSMGLGAAIATFFLGLSLAFGAFIGGMLISESEFRHQTLAEVPPPA